MFKRSPWFNAILALAAIFISQMLVACNLSRAGGTITPLTQQAIYTSAAQTIQAQIEQTAAAAPTTTPTSSVVPEKKELPTVTLSPTATLLPPTQAEVLQPTGTPTLSPTPTSTLTPTTAVTLINARINTNCRSGPGPGYRIVGYLLVGQEVEVVGRNLSEQWWYIHNPGKPGQFCWVWSETTHVSGEIASLPVLLARQTPVTTITAFFEIESVNVTLCGGTPAVIFGVTNTSSVIFESASLTLEDLTRDITLYGPVASNVPFTRTDRLCPPGTSSLKPEQTAYVGGALGVRIPKGYWVRGTIELCTKDDLFGKCYKSSIEFVNP